MPASRTHFRCWRLTGSADGDAGLSQFDPEQTSEGRGISRSAALSTELVLPRRLRAVVVDAAGAE